MGRIYDPKLFVDRGPELTGFGKLLQPATPQAVLLIEASELMGKTWLLDRMGDQSRPEAAGDRGEAVAQPPLAKIDFRQQANMIQDTLSLVRLIRDALRQPEYFSDLNAVINWFTKGRLAALVAAMNGLAETLESHLDLEEVKRVSRALSIEYENLEGGERGTLYEKCYSLVATLEDQQRLPELFTELKQRYPNLDWSQAEQAIMPVLTTIRQATSAAGTPIEDLGAPLPVDGRSQAEIKINEAFFACLHKLEGDHKPVIVLFDSLEDAPEYAAPWIRDELLGQLQAGQLTDVVVVAAGRKPSASALQSADASGLMVHRDLEGFDEKDIRAFLDAYHVPYDDARLSFYIDTSGGKPGLLAQMQDNQLARQHKEDPFFQ